MTASYNGWTNYETWAVNLWLSNDQGTDRYWRETAHETWDDAEKDPPLSRSERARFDLSDQLKHETEDGSPLSDVSSVYSDLLTAALSEVEWHEIADGLLEDCDGYEPMARAQGEAQ